MSAFPLASHAACLFICLPGLSLLVSLRFRWRCNISIVSLVVSALFRWPCSISIHLSSRSVAAVRPSINYAHSDLSMESFYSFVSQVCRCWCPPFPVGHAAFLCVCLPGLSLLVSALFRWSCNISIHVSPRFVSGVRPFPLGPSLVVSALFRWPCSCSIHLSPFSFLLSPFSFPFLLVTVSVLFVTVSALSPFLSPFLLAIVPVLSPFCFLLSPFLSPFLLMSQKVDLGMLRCCPTCLGSTVV